MESQDDVRYQTARIDRADAFRRFRRSAPGSIVNPQMREVFLSALPTAVEIGARVSINRSTPSPSTDAASDSR